MPTYEYRCRTCDTRFELRRAIDEADAPASCPQGHEGARRLLSVFAAGGTATAPAGGGHGGGGCCGGGGCVCHPG